MGLKFTKEAQMKLLKENLTDIEKEEIIKMIFDTSIIDQKVMNRIVDSNINGKYIIDRSNDSEIENLTDKEKIDRFLNVLKTKIPESTKELYKNEHNKSNNKKELEVNNNDNNINSKTESKVKNAESKTDSIEPKVEENKTINQFAQEVRQLNDDYYNSTKAIPKRRNRKINIVDSVDYDKELKEAVKLSEKESKEEKKRQKQIENDVKTIAKQQNLKKPSFNIFKSFIRLFNKNAFLNDYNEYQRRLNEYNKSINTIRETLEVLNSLKISNELQKENNIHKESKELNTKIETIVNKKRTEIIANKNNTPVNKNQQISRPVKQGVFDNLRVVKNDESFDKYADDIMSKKTGLKMKENTAEYIALASFNIEELTDLQEFIKDKDELKHLDVAITYKINNLLNDSPKMITRFDAPYTCRENSYFIKNIITRGFINDIRKNASIGVVPYKDLSNNPKPKSHFTADNIENANNKIRNRDNKSDINITGKLVSGKNGDNYYVLTDIPKTEVQTSDNGCWSCSMNILLKQQGITDLTQGDIRAFRPDSKLDIVKSENPIAQIKDRFELAYRVSEDKPNEIADFTDIIHKTTKNVAYIQKQITGSPEEAYNQIKDIIVNKKKPVSFLYNGHYRTVIGVDNGNLIMEDSLVKSKPYYKTGDDGLNEFYKTRYPFNCVQNIQSFNKFEITISYLDSVDKIDPNEYAKNNMQGMDEINYYARKEGRSFHKFTDNNGVVIEEEVILPNDYLVNVKKLDGVTLKENKVRIEINQLNENYLNNTENSSSKVEEPEMNLSRNDADMNLTQ